jgi:hypothetical protein
MASSTIPHYTLNGTNYISSFPTQYFPLKKGTGPECANCVYYSSLDEVFIGFCYNCIESYDCGHVDLFDYNNLFLPHYITEEEEKIIYDLCVKIDKFSYENNKNDDDENVYEDENACNENYEDEDEDEDE